MATRIGQRISAHPVTAWLLVLLPVPLAVIPLVSGSPTFQAAPWQWYYEFFGNAATIYLVAVLCLSPLRVLIGKMGIVRGLNRHRRIIGVAAFVYALAHFGTYLMDVGGWPGLRDNLDKAFIIAGIIALVLLFILSVTSLKWFVRKLGRRWKLLHRSAYIAAILVLYHQAVQEKAGVEEATLMFAPLVVLQVARVGKQVWVKRREATGANVYPS